MKTYKNSITGEKYITIRDTKEGKKFSIELYLKEDESGKRRKVKVGTFKTLESAVKRRDTVLEEIANGTYVHPFKAGGKRYSKELINKIIHLAVTTDMPVTHIAKKLNISDKGAADHVKRARADAKNKLKYRLSTSYLLRTRWTTETLRIGKE